MMINEMKAASALGAKTTRACDSCLRVRARWYCAADDAFLCHGCDNLVHSANQLASKHERVRLQTASSKVKAQTWHSGFTRKARTPRHNNKHLLVQQRSKKDEEQVVFNNTSSLLHPLVPELGSEEQQLLDDNENEEEQQLLCLVPVFDPFDAELCSLYNEVKDEGLDTIMKNDVVAGDGEEEEEEVFDLDNFSLPSHMELAEFDADVETLLGNGFDEDSCGQMKGSELLGCKEEDEIDAYVNRLGDKGAMVKVKDEEFDADTACHLDSILDMNSEAFDWNVDSESLAVAAQEEEEEKVAVPVAASCGAGKLGTNKKIFLRLNYEEVITAWASQGSPWITGSPRNFNFDNCWPDYLGFSGADVQCSYGEVRSLRGSIDEGREARVSRYREKRRTRLFAKKIRYEVRKLNAEKRPRMKGRFVKRTSFVGGTSNLPA
ncbi:zinc finger protein CONSTANS-LIKE 16-like [Gastrolobium bilobum]|uniref:zinc finger protein CONSTANS-LIKE 16-like n=1 Tax=Gastrolobium bilobum TaxID=150636 RepID=UPI002AB026BC|nr:zinc finger protein CONSTANS-LIKE 16-like [Gastrolobium bilobum]XP_061370958.1 zinc finger protein CONSTANS-LIKE 16-like [Gastrolobium bilobum]